MSSYFVKQFPVVTKNECLQKNAPSFKKTSQSMQANAFLGILEERKKMRRQRNEDNSVLKEDQNVNLIGSNDCSKIRRGNVKKEPKKNNLI